VTLYVDASALAKRYVDEEDSDQAESLLLSDRSWATAIHTYVEVVLALSRRLGEAELRIAREGFERDWRRLLVIAVDDAVCRRAAELGASTGSRTLDALHLAAAERAGARAVPIVTFDLILARSARSVGFSVLGA
jgi:predicted nucleic acid-binding protein